MNGLMESITTEEVAAMTAVEEAALACFKKGEESLSPGIHPVDFIVHVQGTLKVGEPFESAPTTSIPLKAALALLVRRMGFQRDAALTILRRVLQEAMTVAGSAEAALLADTGVEEALWIIQREVIAKLPKRQNKGRVTSALTVTKL